MQVHRAIEKLPEFKNAVLTIGTFDGVHEGHKKIIQALKREAREADGETVIVTFDPHPRKIVKPEDPIVLINTLEEKTILLEQAGIDHLVIVPFTSAFADRTASEYLEQFLIHRFHPTAIIIGYDHHFGKGREGNFSFLEQQASRFGYKLIEIPGHVLEEVAVSSTKIRKALLNSDIATANTLLGYTFFFEGLVVEGDKLGRQLGYPTANLEYTDREKIHLGHGVYAVYVAIGTEIRKGMLSIGNRPTLVRSGEKVEVNIFDWDKDIYGERIRITVAKYLRPQEKYPTLEALKQQLHLDKQNSLAVL
ncbi:MAG TPA: bifunctional riboflavin kinase/FAD synthetase [Flavisolibacter sp.]|nr:bifunctional riboflavin kinase/FAD synthetase [Flavisolibacter sp.]